MARSFTFAVTIPNKAFGTDKTAAVVDDARDVASDSGASLKVLEFWT